MKRVFISHPYKDEPKGNKKRADTICRELAEKDDILPISPLHLFSFMKDDSNREEILQTMKQKSEWLLCGKSNKRVTLQ